jgi:hypothetical protein
MPLRRVLRENAILNPCAMIDTNATISTMSSNRGLGFSSGRYLWGELIAALFSEYSPQTYERRYSCSLLIGHPLKHQQLHKLL